MLNHYLKIELICYTPRWVELGDNINNNVTTTSLLVLVRLRWCHRNNMNFGRSSVSRTSITIFDKNKLWLLVIIKRILSSQKHFECDTQLINNNNKCFELPPLGPTFTSLTPFSAALWMKHRIWFFTRHQSSLVKETFITLSPGERGM